MGAGESFSPNVSAPPPHPPEKVLLKKKLQLFQIKIFFDDDFEESVKVANVQKCDFSQPEHFIFKIYTDLHLSQFKIPRSFDPIKELINRPCRIN